MKSRASWRKLIRERCSSFEEKQVTHAELKRALRKQDDSAVPADVMNELKCSVCRSLLLSKAGLVNHLKSHRQWSNEEVDEEALPGRPRNHTCHYMWLGMQVSWRFDLALQDTQRCSSAGNFKRRKFQILHLQSTCETKAGLKSHLRAHNRAVNN